MASAGNAYRHENAVAVDRAAKTALFSFEISLLEQRNLIHPPENYGHFPIPCFRWMNQTKIRFTKFRRKRASGGAVTATDI